MARIPNVLVKRQDFLGYDDNLFDRLAAAVAHPKTADAVPHVFDGLAAVTAHRGNRPGSAETRSVILLPVDKVVDLDALPIGCSDIESRLSVL